MFSYGYLTTNKESVMALGFNNPYRHNVLPHYYEMTYNGASVSLDLSDSGLLLLMRWRFNPETNKGSRTHYYLGYRNPESDLWYSTDIGNDSEMTLAELLDAFKWLYNQSR